VPDWLRTRDEIVRNLRQNNSVNLLVTGIPKWHEMIEHIKKDTLPDLGIVDLESGTTASRRFLIPEILKAVGIEPIDTNPCEPEDLAELERISSRQDTSLLAFEHFDLVKHRPYYDINFFAALRYLVFTSRKLVLLIQSISPFSELLPTNHSLSSFDLKIVKLQGKT
jgi:hypothetical protein